MVEAIRVEKGRGQSRLHQPGHIDVWIARASHYLLYGWVPGEEAGSDRNLSGSRRKHTVFQSRGGCLLINYIDFNYESHIKSC